MPATGVGSRSSVVSTPHVSVRWYWIEGRFVHSLVSGLLTASRARWRVRLKPTSAGDRFTNFYVLNCESDKRVHSAL
jgi:hypothetical protein